MPESARRGKLEGAMGPYNGKCVCSLLDESRSWRCRSSSRNGSQGGRATARKPESSSVEDRLQWSRSISWPAEEALTQRQPSTRSASLHQSLRTRSLPPPARTLGGREQTNLTHPCPTRLRVFPRTPAPAQKDATDARITPPRVADPVGPHSARRRRRGETRGRDDRPRPKVKGGGTDGDGEIRSSS